MTYLATRNRPVFLKLIPMADKKEAPTPSKAEGNLLRKRREDMRLTMQQFADKFGYTQSTISKFESGDLKVPDGLLKTPMEVRQVVKKSIIRTTPFVEEGQKLKALREKYRASQKQFANKYGFSESMISKYEAGEFEPPSMLFSEPFEPISKKKRKAKGSSKPKPHLKAQGNRLKMIRDELKLSQEQFADKLGASQTTIQRYESGENRIPIEIWAKLNVEHGVSIEWGTIGKGSKKSTPEDKKLIVEIGKLQEQMKLQETKLNLQQHFIDLIFANVAELKKFNENIENSTRNRTKSS